MAGKHLSARPRFAAAPDRNDSAADQCDQAAVGRQSSDQCRNVAHHIVVLLDSGTGADGPSRSV